MYSKTGAILQQVTLSAPSATAESTAFPLLPSPGTAACCIPGHIGKGEFHSSSSAELVSTCKSCLDSIRPMSQSDFRREASMQMYQREDVRAGRCPRDTGNDR